MLVAFLATALTWPPLVAGAVQSFGTVGLFLTAYGVLFSVIEVLRTQSLTLEVGRAADRAARTARGPYDMRDVSECATTIESTLHALQHDGTPRSQPLSRIVRLYTAIFQERYCDDQSSERIRIGIVQSHAMVGRRAKKDDKLEQALMVMLGDIAAKGGELTKEATDR